jgi:tRNA(fMet)-specific endonuclease VapC
VSLYVLDTDTLTLLQRGNPGVLRRVGEHPPDELAITVITVEEQLSGWYGLLRKARGRRQLAGAYQQLADSVRDLSSLRVLSFTEAAIARYEHLKTLKLNVGTMDLRIAASVLEHDGVLVTRNLRDFQRVPGLKTEDWSQ